MDQKSKLKKEHLQRKRNQKSAKNQVLFLQLTKASLCGGEQNLLLQLTHKRRFAVVLLSSLLWLLENDFAFCKAFFLCLREKRFSFIVCFSRGFSSSPFYSSSSAAAAVVYYTTIVLVVVVVTLTTTNCLALLL